jgi:hypothetical protein
MNLRSQRGEGLISVMISIAILGVLVVTVVTLYQMYGNMMAKSLLRREADNLANSIRQTLSRRELCSTALAGNVWNGAGDANVIVRDHTGAIIAQTGMVIGNGRLVMNRVVIRPFTVDADADGTRDVIPGSTQLNIGATNVLSLSGEVVIEFGLAMDAVQEGSIAERKAAVLVLVDSVTNVIQRCDMNEESTRIKVCDDEQRVIDDGNSCGPIPAPNVASECSMSFYVGSVDVTGEPKCFCRWLCSTPIWRDIIDTGICQPLAGVAGPVCPAPLSGGVPPRPTVACYGLVGTVCRWSVSRPGACGFATPFKIFQSTCKESF